MVSEDLSPCAEGLRGPVSPAQCSVKDARVSQGDERVHCPGGQTRSRLTEASSRGPLS